MPDFTGVMNEESKKELKELEAYVSHVNAKIEVLKMLTQVNANGIKVTVSTTKRVISIKTPVEIFTRSSWESARDFMIDYMAKNCTQ
jgi:hypothetical protein